MPTFPLPKTEKPETKISEKYLEKVLRKCRFSDVMFRHFGSKNGKCLKTARMFCFEVRRNQKNAKRRKIKRFTKWLSGIFDIFSILTLKIQNLNF